MLLYLCSYWLICSLDAGTLVLVLLAGLLTACRVIHSHLDRRYCRCKKLTPGSPTLQSQKLHETGFCSSLFIKGSKSSVPGKKSCSTYGSKNSLMFHTQRCMQR